VACVLHASDRGIFAGSIESVGKQARDESGKHPVNEDDEEILRISARHDDARLKKALGSNVQYRAQMRTTSLQANGSRECAPDDRLREAMHRAAIG
jgi:hypothetical protein